MTLREELQQEDDSCITFPATNYTTMFVGMPDVVSVLNINEGTLVLQSTKKMPNPVWRFFQWALLGFKWSKP